MNRLTLFDPWESSLLCLTLLHSIWQFALVAWIAWLLDRTLRTPTAERSYAIHVAFFVVGLAAVPFTYSLLQNTMPPNAMALDREVTPLFDAQPAIASSIRPTSTSETSSPQPQLLAGEVHSANIAAGHKTLADSRPRTWLLISPWVAGLYVGGVILMLVRLMVGILRAERLRKLSRPIVDGPLVESLQNLSRHWSLRVIPMLAYGEQIVVPRVIGLLKPTIVLPVSALTGMRAYELEMILAHELAHIRRHDMWIHVLQRLAEAALFFNPAMWYLSRRIGTLREYCCDELTCRSISGSGFDSRMRYAQALLNIVQLAKLSAADHRSLAALAASGRSPSELRRRIARLFGEPLREPVRLSRGGMLIMAAAMLLVVWAPAIWPTSAQTPQTETAAEPTGESAIRKAAKEFSFGGSVEILAIGTHDENPQRWWDEIGILLETVPFAWREQGRVMSPDTVWRRIVFRVDPLPDDAGVQWHLEGARASAGGTVTIDGEQNPRGYFTRYFGVSDDQKTVDLRLGIATGPWRTAVSIGAAGPNATGGTGGKSLVSSGAIETAGGTVVVISHNYNEQNYRVVAIDKKGESHESVSSGGAGAGDISQTRPTFPGIKPADIDHFAFQIRDYEWVEFKELPLYPAGTDLPGNDGAAATEKPDPSPAAAKKRADWLAKLSRLSSHKPTAFDVGPSMILELPADDALAVVRQVWPTLQVDEVKTGLLKTFEFGRHPRVLDVLDLGARDESQEVREYAFAYLQNYAMRNFKQAEHDYSAWRRHHAGQTVDQVLQENAKWFVNSLGGTKPADDQLWWIDFYSKLNVDGGKSTYPNKAKYLHNAGLIEVLQNWREDPSAGNTVKQEATEIMQHLRKASLAENDSHRDATLRGDALPNLVLNKGVDELFFGADLRECDLSGAMLVGGTRAFYDADLSAANLADATLIGEGAFQLTKFNKAILTNAVLKGNGADFQAASFEEANLQNARLSGGASSFQEASFKNADLTAARLQGGGASFQAATFDNAKLIRTAIVCTGMTAFQAVRLNNTDFSGADLSTIDAQSLASCEFHSTSPPKYTAQTRFPQGFDPKQAGWQRIEELGAE